MPARLSFYLIRRTLIGISVMAAAVTGTILLVDLVEQLRSTGARSSSLSLLGALHLTALKTPQLLEQTLPFVVLIGTMMALNQLNRRSELIAMRAAGVSAWRFLAPVVGLAVAIGLFTALVLNPIGARLYSTYEIERAIYISDDPSRRAAEDAPIWLRQGDELGQVVISARSVDPSKARLQDAVFFFFELSKDGQLRFMRRVGAETADLRPGFWKLSNVVDATPGAPPQRSDRLAVPTRLEPTALLDRYVSPQTLSFYRLPGVISEAEAAGLTPTRYELRWQSLLAAPLLFAAMAALGAVFSLRLSRLGNGAVWSMIGLGSGFLLFFLGQLASAFATAQVAPVSIAVWAPPLSGVFAAMAILGYLEDG